MGVFDKLGQAFGTSKEMNIEEYMNSVEMENVDLLHEPADMYVKPVSISSEDEVKAIQDEISRKNVIDALKAYVTKLNGDIGQIDATRILITPAKVKIIKRKR